MPIPSVSLSVKNASVKEWLNRLPLLICAFGILVRSVQYLSNRSIWLDEARLLLNIVERSYFDLLRPLDHNQAAPPGFLLVERFNLELFGNNEYALRLFPFICGILSIFVFYQLAKQLLPKSTFLIALVLFNCMPRLIYFSSEAKQYSSDLFVALLLTWLLYQWRDRVLNLKQQILLGLAGVVAIGFSHPAVFTLGGTEAALFLMTGKQRWQRLKNRTPAYVMWLAAFAALYFLMVQSTLEANEELVDSWGRRYPTSIFDINWLINNVATKYCGYFYSFLGSSTLIDILVTLVFLVGCVAFYRRDRRNFFILVGFDPDCRLSAKVSFPRTVDFVSHALFCDDDRRWNSNFFYADSTPLFPNCCDRTSQYSPHFSGCTSHHRNPKRLKRCAPSRNI